MEFSFVGALNALGGPPQVVKIANETRPPGDYVYSTILPEIQAPTYNASALNMIIRATMAGPVAMDSPYPEVSVAQTEEFREQTIKIGGRSRLTEAALRTIQQILTNTAARQGGLVDMNFVVNEALNFLDKVVMQPQVDTMEWLRGQALLNGKIDWQFGNIHVVVDYRPKAANILPASTGNNAYGGSTSQFWNDIRKLRQILRHNVRAFIIHPDLYDVIVSNPVNNVRVNSGDIAGGTVNITRMIAQNGTNTPSTDNRDNVDLILYGLEGEIFDPVVPGHTTRIPFHNRGKILAIGQNQRNGYRVGEGSTDNPQYDKALGRTHIGPTTEGGGAMGRWARLYTPQDYPMQLHGEAVTNGLPVIDAPEKVAVATSDVPTYAPYPAY